MPGRVSLLLRRTVRPAVQRRSGPRRSLAEARRPGSERQAVHHELSSRVHTVLCFRLTVRFPD